MLTRESTDGGVLRDRGPGDDRRAPVGEVLLRRILIVARQVGLDRSDRLDLAEYLLGRRVASWGDLRVSEAERVRDALEGFVAIRFLRGETFVDPRKG